MAESPCRVCPKATGEACWCPKLGAWQESRFGEKRAAIYRAEVLGKKHHDAALKAWATRRRQALT